MAGSDHACKQPGPTHASNPLLGTKRPTKRPTKTHLFVHEKPTSLATEAVLYSSTSLPSLGSSSQRDHSVAIERALRDDPRKVGIDVGQLRTLRSLDAQWTRYRKESGAPIADTVFSPMLQSKVARELLAESGADLSRRYNSSGMACLPHNAEVAYECLQRALFTATRSRDSQAMALALSHLGVHAQTQAKTAQALRYLRRAVAVRGGSLASRVRVRLNLCTALNQLGEHSEALRAAEIVLVASDGSQIDDPDRAHVDRNPAEAVVAPKKKTGGRTTEKKKTAPELHAEGQDPVPRPVREFHRASGSSAGN